MTQEADNPALLQVLVLERVDRARNMARYYVLSVEPTLFEGFRPRTPLGAHRRRRAGADRLAPLTASRPSRTGEVAQPPEAPRLRAPGLTVSSARREIDGCSALRDGENLNLAVAHEEDISRSSTYQRPRHGADIRN